MCADEEDAAAGEALSQDEVAAKLQEPAYFGALQLLCDEAGFLVDSKAHKMLASLPKHQDEGLIHAEVRTAPNLRHDLTLFSCCLSCATSV